MNVFNSNIKFIRTREGLSQKQFGELFDLSRGQINSYEEKSEPNFDTLRRIVNHYNIDLTKFLSIEMTDLNYETFIIQEGSGKSDPTPIYGSTNTDTLKLLLKLKSPTLNDQERTVIVDEVSKRIMQLVDENGQLKNELVESMRRMMSMKY